jgi:hypothetical protein
MKDILFRFLIGGAVVSSFAILGDLFKPKSFAGLSQPRHQLHWLLLD